MASGPTTLWEIDGKTVSTICSDFGAQKNKVSHCFYCLPMNMILNHASDGVQAQKEGILI